MISVIKNSAFDDAPKGRKREKVDHGKVKPFFYDHLLSEGWRWWMRHPLRFLVDLGRVIKHAWFRAMWGWSDMDIWNLEHHLALILPPMLRRLANGNSYAPYVRIGDRDMECSGDEGELYGALLESCAKAFDAYIYWRSETFPENYNDEDAMSQHWEMERQATLGAQIALKLIADNFPTLWD